MTFMIGFAAGFLLGGILGLFCALLAYAARLEHDRTGRPLQGEDIAAALKRARKT